MVLKAVEPLELHQDLEVGRWLRSNSSMDHSTEWQRWDIIRNRWVIQDVLLTAANNQTKARSLQTVDTMAKETLTDQEVHQTLLIIQSWDHQVQASSAMVRALRTTLQLKPEWNITKVSKPHFLNHLISNSSIDMSGSGNQNISASSTA